MSHGLVAWVAGLQMAQQNLELILVDVPSAFLSLGSPRMPGDAGTPAAPHCLLASAR
jgi:hypothetical protein